MSTSTMVGVFPTLSEKGRLHLVDMYRFADTDFSGIRSVINSTRGTVWTALGRCSVSCRLLDPRQGSAIFDTNHTEPTPGRVRRFSNIIASIYPRRNYTTRGKISMKKYDAPFPSSCFGDCMASNYPGRHATLETVSSGTPQGQRGICVNNVMPIRCVERVDRLPYIT